jgi:hypothetical protein
VRRLKELERRGVSAGGQQLLGALAISIFSQIKKSSAFSFWAQDNIVRRYTADR